MWLYAGEPRRTDVPEDARLISALPDAVRDSVTLRDVTSRLTGQHSRLREKYPNVNFQHDPLPAPFYDLVLGRELSASIGEPSTR